MSECINIVFTGVQLLIIGCALMSPGLIIGAKRIGDLELPEFFLVMIMFTVGVICAGASLPTVLPCISVKVI